MLWHLTPTAQPSAMSSSAVGRVGWVLEMFLCVSQGLTAALSIELESAVSHGSATTFVGEDHPYHFITGTSVPFPFQWWILRTKIAPKLCAREH